METLISADNSIALMAVLCAIVALAIILEQRYKWASKLTGCILVLLITLILSNVKVIPVDAPVYGFVYSYLVPLAIPLLLFSADMKSIFKESGKLLVLFIIGAIGTFVGALIAYPVVGRFLAEGPKFMAMITASYIGGGVNFLAMAENYGASGNTVATANVADALTMMFFMFALMTIPTMNFFRKRFLHPIEDKLAEQAAEHSDVKGTNVAAYWARKEISLKDIALAIGVALVIVAISTPVASFFSGLIPTTNFFFRFFNALLGSKWLIITVFTVLAATIFSKQFKDIRGTRELGTYFIYLFFAVMSAPVSLRLLVNEAPLFFAVCMIVVIVHLFILLIGTKLLKFGIEDAMIASVANIAGGGEAAAISIAKGWDSLVVPGILVGTFGTVIGNIFGILIGTIFGA